MIDPTGRLHSIAPAESVVSTSRRTQPAKSQSFATELSDKLSSKTQTAELAASLPAGQVSVTWRHPGGTTSNSTGATSQPTGLNGLVISYPSTTSTTSTTEAGTGTSSQGTSFDETYWASQPAAVQQLQNIQSPTERAQLASQLAQQGYSIDVPIMVWGWDPATTTAARESMGYTWVPSAEQQPVEVAPGLTYAGNSYNPSQPPTGSITV